MAPTPITVTMQDAVRLTGLSRATLYRHIQAGRLPILKAGGRTLVRVAALDTFLRSLEVSREAA